MSRVLPSTSAKRNVRCRVSGGAISTTQGYRSAPMTPVGGMTYQGSSQGRTPPRDPWPSWIRVRTVNIGTSKQAQGGRTDARTDSIHVRNERRNGAVSSSAVATWTEVDGGT